MPPPLPVDSLPSGLPPAIAQVLARRGVRTAEELQLFLEPPQRMPYDPLRLAGMEPAVRRIYQAIERQETVGVFGDFDVDGVTGTAILAQALEAFGLTVLPYLPHRMEEGHGLSAAAVKNLVDQGASLIITVDTGVAATDEVAYARGLGADVIITDHHVPHSGLPDAAGVINPHLGGGTYPFYQLCGAGLAFKLAQGLYQFHGQPWDRSLLELAALGTIADLVPLVDENRYLVQAGLAALGETRRPGLQAMFRLAGVQPGPLTVETVAFQVSPRLNSPGRLGDSIDSFRLLTTASTAEAQELAEKLESLNRQRRDLTQAAMEAAARQVPQRAEISELPPVLMVSGPEITRGLAGLVAGRLAEDFQRPAVAMAVEDEFIVGSGRSIPEVDIFQAFSNCEDLFVRFGGHSQAAGFTLPREDLPIFEERLTALVGEALPKGDLQPVLNIDVEVGLDELNNGLRDWLAQLEPFGVGNSRPVFITRRAKVLDDQRVGADGQHVRLKVTQGGSQCTALAFNQSARWGGGATEVDLVYTLMLDRWQGVERLTLKVLDFRPAQA